MKRPASWRTIRNRWKQHGRELAALAAKHRGKVEVYGRLYAITGTFHSFSECNAWLEKNPDSGVIKCVPDWPKEGESFTAYTARLDDKGE